MRRYDLRRGCGLLVLLAMMNASHLSADTITPPDLPGCVLWLDASDASTVDETIDWGFVGQWRDKSGNGRHVSQETFAHQPRTRVASQGGRNVLTFDGADWLTGTAVLAGGDDDFTYLVVWQPRVVGGGQTIFEQSETPQAVGTRAALLASNGSYGFNGESNDRNDLVAFSSNVWRLTALVLDGNVSGNVHVFDNGNDEVVGAINIATEHVGTSGFRVGAKLTTDGEALNGDVAEIIVYDRVLTDSERDTILYYLDQKWGLGMGLTPTPGIQVQYEFEDGVLPTGWTTTGTAFSTQPARSSRVEFKESGQWFLGTFENESAGGNGSQGEIATGSLTGDAILLQGNTVRSRISGGHFNGVGAECQLVLEQETSPGNWQFARSETGTFTDAMREYLWNVGDLRGKNVRFRVVDNNTAGWGLINVDALRIGNEPHPRKFHTDFTGTRLDPALAVYRPLLNPGAGLTGSGRFRFDTSVSVPGGTDSYDLWDTVNHAPQLRLPVDESEVRQFRLETRLVSRSYSQGDNHSGLILGFSDPSVAHYDFVAFGPFRDQGLWAQGPTFGDALTALSGAVTNIDLRVERVNNTYRFFYSTDGETWTPVGERVLPGKKLLYVGLFAKSWNQTDSPVVEFDRFHFEGMSGGTVLIFQ